MGRERSPQLLFSHVLAARTLSLLAAATLAACGGGGGGSSLTSPALAAAVAAPAAAGATATSGEPGAPPPSAPANREPVTVWAEGSHTLADDADHLRLREDVGGSPVLTGNARDNHIVGGPFAYEEIYGLEGHDVLDGGGRHGALLDGGPGDDRLIVSFGELRGGPGADTFVAGGRGAHTGPEAAIEILDFTPAEGDRIELGGTPAGRSAADLFAQGYVRFDSSTGRLTQYGEAAVGQPAPLEQVFVLRGLDHFEPDWLVLR